MDLSKVFQSWSIPILRGYEGDANPEIGPDKPLMFPPAINPQAQVGLEFVTPDPNFEFALKDIEAKVARFLFPFGLNAADFVASKERRSAEGIQYSSARLDELRETLKQRFAATQLELWNIVKVVHNIEGPAFNLKKFSDDCTFTITYYPEKQIPAPWKERQEEYDWKLQRGLTTLPDILVAETEDLDREQAETQILDNMQKNAALGQPVQRPSGSVGVANA